MTHDSGCTRDTDKTARVAHVIMVVSQWLRIVVSPMIAFGVMGGLLYLYLGRTVVALRSAVACEFIGIIIGIIWAEKIRRRTCVIGYMSKLQATDDLSYSVNRTRPE